MTSGVKAGVWKGRLMPLDALQVGGVARFVDADGAGSRA